MLIRNSDCESLTLFLNRTAGLKCSAISGFSYFSAMNRRSFHGSLSLGLGSLFVPSFVQDSLIKPPRLQRGNKVGLIAPGSPVPSDRIGKAVELVLSLGYQPVLGRHVEKHHGYLAGTDQERLEDLHHMFSNNEVKAVWCIRGGYGCTRLLPKIDFDLIRQNPKIFIGYSDITDLHVAFMKQVGLVTFHGPVASSEPTSYTIENLKKVWEAEQSFSIHPLRGAAADPYPRPYVLNPGQASGLLVGGNLSLLAALAGTKWSPSYRDKLVFMEDIGEKPYRIDRMLTQLYQATDLAKASGIILGIFHDCEAKSGENSLTLRETVAQQFGSLNIPVYYGASFGHVDDQCTIPQGLKASFSTEDGVLRILESPTL